MKQSGVSLIELMIVVLIIGLLALFSSALTGGWVDSARVSESIGAMEQAVGQAKAAALRNEAAMTGTDAASVICLSDDQVLSVRSAKPAVSTNPAEAATCQSGGTTPLWSTRLPSSATLKIGTQAWSCICFTNKAILTTADVSCGSCGSSLELTISSGGEHESTKFY